MFIKCYKAVRRQDYRKYTIPTDIRGKVFPMDVCGKVFPTDVCGKNFPTDVCGKDFPTDLFGEVFKKTLVGMFCYQGIPTLAHRNSFNKSFTTSTMKEI